MNASGSDLIYQPRVTHPVEVILKTPAVVVAAEPHIVVAAIAEAAIAAPTGFIADNITPVDATTADTE